MSRLPHPSARPMWDSKYLLTSFLQISRNSCCISSIGRAAANASGENGSLWSRPVRTMCSTTSPFSFLVMALVGCVSHCASSRSCGVFLCRACRLFPGQFTDHARAIQLNPGQVWSAFHHHLYEYPIISIPAGTALAKMPATTAALGLCLSCATSATPTGLQRVVPVNKGFSPPFQPDQACHKACASQCL